MVYKCVFLIKTLTSIEIRVVGKTTLSIEDMIGNDFQVCVTNLVNKLVVLFGEKELWNEMRVCLFNEYFGFPFRQM